jgi:hypothetical protein
MRFRKLRAWSVGWGLLAVLVSVVWVRSYWKSDNVNCEKIHTWVSLTSFRGSLGTLWYETKSDDSSFEYESWEIGKDSTVDYNDGTGHPLPSYLGFKSSWLSAPNPLDTTTLVIPYWFPTLACTAAALAPWGPQLKLRFSLRTLLITTTLVAVVLGLIVWLR